MKRFIWLTILTISAMPCVGMHNQVTPLPAASLYEPPYLHDQPQMPSYSPHGLSTPISSTLDIYLPQNAIIPLPTITHEVPGNQHALAALAYEAQDILNQENPSQRLNQCWNSTRSARCCSLENCCSFRSLACYGVCGALTWTAILLCRSGSCFKNSHGQHPHRQ